MAAENPGFLGRLKRLFSSQGNKKEKPSKHLKPGDTDHVKRWKLVTRKSVKIKNKNKNQSDQNERRKIGRPASFKYRYTGSPGRRPRRPVSMIVQTTSCDQPRDMNKVCVVCTKEQHLNATLRALRSLVIRHMTGGHVTVIGKKIRSGNVEELDKFEGAGLVLLVAVAAARMLIISDVEESQLGVAYREAQNLNVSTAMILTEHLGSNQLNDQELFPNDLTELFRNQPGIADIENRNCFVSVGSNIGHGLHLNAAQETALLNWIKEHIRTDDPKGGSDLLL